MVQIHPPLEGKSAGELIHEKHLQRMSILVQMQRQHDPCFAKLSIREASVEPQKWQIKKAYLYPLKFEGPSQHMHVLFHIYIYIYIYAYKLVYMLEFPPRNPNPAGVAKSKGFPLHRRFPCFWRPSTQGFQSTRSMLAVANPAASKQRLRTPFPENTSTASYIFRAIVGFFEVGGKHLNHFV